MEMDINEIISIAKQNVNEGKNGKNTGYSTQLKGPQKLGRNVNPKAIKEFLNRKKEVEKKQVVEQKVKKNELTKLREEKKTSRKAHAMASRTKDNLLGYKGEDCLGLYKDKRDKNGPILTPEEERRHRAFMNKISKNSISRGFKENPQKEKPSENDLKKQRKLEKNRQRARSEASGLNFNDLISLAENKRKQSSDDESSANSDSDSSSSGAGGNLSAQERFERERRKRKALEAKLKSQNSKKRKSDGSSDFKIAKLSKGMTDTDKQEKIKALMAKFKNKKAEPPDHKSSPKSMNGKFRKPESGVRPKNNSRGPFSKTPRDSKVSLSKPLDKRKNGQESKPTTSRNVPANNKPQIKTNPYMSELKKKKEMQRIKEELTKRKQPDAYSHLMEKAKGNTKPKTQCTLSVTSSGVRTNYPGVAETDPTVVKFGRNSALDENKRRAMEILGRRSRNGHRPPHPLMNRSAPSRPPMFEDDDDDDEYDSELEGFIDDEDDFDCANPTITAAIGKIFGYDKTKYGRESEYELSKMDASFRDIQQEESRSLRIAQKEDALEAKLEEERLKRKNAKRR